MRTEIGLACPQSTKDLLYPTLVFDGVHVKSENGEGLRFLRLPRPSEGDVYDVFCVHVIESLVSLQGFSTRNAAQAG